MAGLDESKLAKAREELKSPKIPAIEPDEAVRFLAAIVASSDDAIISKDLNGIITSWNKGAERIFGYTETEAIGQPILMLIPEGRKDEEPGILSRIRKGEVIDHYETIRRRKDGTLLDISVTVSPVRNGAGEIVGASKIARDITQQKLVQQELAMLAAELKRSKEELELRVEERTASLKDAVAQMEEFSYTVSHDLRAPLRAMIMYANVLESDFSNLFEGEPEAVHYLNRIQANCLRLDRMVQDVLTFGRVARDEIQLRPVDLDVLIKQLVHDYPTLQPGNADIEVPPLHRVMGDEASLVQVFSNLLTNAVKFVQPGTRPRVTLREETEGGLVRIYVEDNGIGIQPRHQSRLFGMFERMHPDLEYEGSGIGLAIVRKAVLRMNGQVGVLSDGENGSRFWVELPAAS